eukprot:TRINITY_DN31043_c0_g1_i1.p1 TRINITY_DN31043_c0_g1~~TRINITY_DN31043_c0_g1_i1.p1  ORF type:complete len:194 (-),score=44.06 TRINITY_DN31043_c0_g1_i1:226-807(-)
MTRRMTMCRMTMKRMIQRTIEKMDGSIFRILMLKVQVNWRIMNCGREKDSNFLAMDGCEIQALEKGNGILMITTFQGATFNWRSGANNFDQDQTSESYFWNLLFPEDLLFRISDFTNEYADEWRNSNNIFDPENPQRNCFGQIPNGLFMRKSLDVVELKRYFGVCLIIGVVRFPNLHMYWSKSQFQNFNIGKV